MKHRQPNEETVKDMLAALFGDNLEVTASESPVQDSYAAVYVDADDTPGAVALCDPAFAAYAGAALSMMPPNGAKEAAESNDIPKTMFDNLHEVMNICTRLIIGESTPHLRLAKVCPAGETDAVDAIRETATRADFQVDIPRYGSGGLAFFVT